MLYRILLILALILLAPFGPVRAQDTAETASDQGYLTNFLQSRLSGAGRDVRIEGFRGALSSRATFERITIADDQGVWLTLRNGAIQWNRAQLLRGVVSVGELSAAEIDLPRLPRSGSEPGNRAPETRGFSLPELPVGLHINQIDAEKVMLGDAILGEPVTMRVNGKLDLSGGEGTADLRIERTDDTRGVFAVATGFSNDTRVLKIDLTLDEGPGGILSRMIDLSEQPSVSGRIEGDGPLSDFTATISLATDGQPQIAGTVALKAEQDAGGADGTSFSVDLGGNVAALTTESGGTFFGENARIRAQGWRAATGRIDIPTLDIVTDALKISGQFATNDRNAPERARLNMQFGQAAGAARLPVALPGTDPAIRVQTGRLDLTYDASAGSGWTLDGSFDGIERDGMRMDGLVLSGAGEVALQDQALQGIGGDLALTAQGIAFDDRALADAVGRSIALKTGFDFTPGQAFRLTDLTLDGNEFDLSGRMAADGLQSGMRLTARIDARHSNLSILSGVAGRDLSGTATAEIRGSYELLTRAFKIDAVIDGDDIGIDQKQVDNLLRDNSRIELSARRGVNGIALDDLTVTAQRLRLNAKGRLATDATNLTAQFELPSLADLDPAYGGRLQADASITGPLGQLLLKLDGEATDLATGITEIDGALGGRTSLTVQARQQGEGLAIETLRLTNPQLDVAGQGSFAPDDMNGQLRLSLPDLGVMGAGWRGSLQADAALAEQDDGTRRLSVTGTGRDLALGVQQIDNALRGATNLNVQAVQRDGVFTIETAQLTNPQANASATGTFGGGRTDLTAQLRAASLAFLGRGLGGSVNLQAHVQDRTGGRRITASGSADNLRVGNTQADTLLRGHTTLDAVVVQGSNRLTIERLNARNPQLHIIADGDPASGLNIDGRLANLATLVPGIPGSAQVTGRVAQGAQNYDVDLTAVGPGGTQARITGTAARDFSNSNLRISGVTDAAVANPFLRTRSVEGGVNFDLRMSGPPGLGALSGRVAMANGRLAEPKLGLSIDPLNVAADFNQGMLNIDATGQVGDGGTITVRGPVDLAGNQQLDLAVHLNNVHIRDPYLYQIQAWGDVRVTGIPADGPLVSGTINIGTAEFQIPSTGLGGTKDIPDINHVGATWPVRETLAKAGIEPYGSPAAQSAGLGGPAATPPDNPARLDLTINAPNQVFIRGRGVDAEMGGTIRLTGTARDVIPIGFLELIRGRVDLLGKRFDLNEGLIELQGSLMPIIRLVAVNQQDAITTSIIIDGELRDPEISFESSPDMPQEEVLSQLLFGRGLDSISALQAAQLANALAVLAGRGGVGIIGNLREQTGLDDLDLQSDDEGNISVRAGKYLSKNLYTDVQVGDEGTSSINLNLDVTQELTARGSVGSDGNSSIGLFYERDF